MSPTPQLSAQGKASHAKILVTDSGAVQDFQINTNEARLYGDNLSPMSNPRLQTTQDCIIENDDSERKILTNDSSVRFATFDPNGPLSGEYQVDLIKEEKNNKNLNITNDDL